MINLTETKRIKELLLQNPADYLKIIEETTLGICITDIDGKYVAVNQAYLKIYGYQKEELIGKVFTIVVPEAHHASIMMVYANFMRARFEILRRWTVLNKEGDAIEIYADAGFNDKINQAPHKVTFVDPVYK